MFSSYFLMSSEIFLELPETQGDMHQTSTVYISFMHNLLK
jgi:hypothetical protein